MLAEITHKGKTFSVNLGEPIDISMPLKASKYAASAWYVDPLIIEPVQTEQFTGSVALGGSVNFNNIFFNPHGHGTHTECVGHISKEFYSVNNALKTFFFTAELISVKPEKWPNGDEVITRSQVETALEGKSAEAIIIRTLPNLLEKRHRNYSSTNPPYLAAEAMEFLVNKGFEHLLIDLPSVDREMDEGVLASHHLFWNYPSAPNTQKTITEFVFVSDEVRDGRYLLNLQIAPFENDASPSKPILYEIK
jgi:arylformamidase